MTEVIKEVFQVLLGLAQIGIQPVMQAGAAHKWPQQRNIAVVRRIAAPREQGIGGRRQRGDNQQTPRLLCVRLTSRTITTETPAETITVPRHCSRKPRRDSDRSIRMPCRIME